LTLSVSFIIIMKVTPRRAVIEDAEVLLELINAAYKHEGKWKVEEKRTSLKELTRLIPAQDVDSETQEYQVLLVLVADTSEDISLLSESGQKSRIVGHVRYDNSFPFRSAFVFMFFAR
jgi:hypothetical protein